MDYWLSLKLFTSVCNCFWIFLEFLTHSKVMVTRLIRDPLWQAIKSICGGTNTSWTLTTPSLQLGMPFSDKVHTLTTTTKKVSQKRKKNTLEDHKQNYHVKKRNPHLKFYAPFKRAFEKCFFLLLACYTACYTFFHYLFKYSKTLYTRKIVNDTWQKSSAAKSLDSFTVQV